MGGEGNEPSEDDQDQLITIIKAQLDKLRGTEQGTSKEDIERLEQELARAQESLDSTRTKAGDKEIEISSIQQELEALKVQLSEKQTEIETLNSEIVTLKENLEGEQAARI